jgi:hypothetical protein
VQVGGRKAASAILNTVDENRTPISRLGERWSMRSREDRRYALRMTLAFFGTLGFILFMTFHPVGWAIIEWFAG